MNTDTKRLWILKTVSEDERSYTSINGYEDSISEKYEYDNFVANHKQVQKGDWGIIVDKTKILGFLKIHAITTFTKPKIRRRCPVEGCGSTNYETRKKKHPVYRCNKGHEFENFVSETISSTAYVAHYKESFIPPGTNFAISRLKSYYNNGYNRNMSIQSFDFKFFENHFPDIPNLLNQSAAYLMSSEAFILNEESYIPDNEDYRLTIKRQIKERRGDRSFRNALIRKYGKRCVITNCQLLDVLEAAHIKPYRGIQDNHHENGLLLRADVHTLFDLNLIGIHPETLMIHVCKTIQSDPMYKKLHETRLILHDENMRPNKRALEIRWAEFSERIKNL